MSHSEQFRERVAAMSISCTDKDAFVEALGFERAGTFFEQRAEMVLAIETYIRFASL